MAGAVGAVLELDGVSRAFPGAKALTGVSMAVASGEVRALLGENGAGKSTLIKIITGAIAADTGVVRVGGQLLRRATPRAAQRLGVRAIHQERQIAPDLTVAENVYLEAPPRNGAGLATRHAAIRRATELLAELGIDLDPAANAGLLTAAQQQLIELARAVSARARVVIMDEPTASLHPGEVATLFAVVRRLRADGVAVLYVSHHLDEVFEIADRATVLRNGAHVADVDIRPADPAGTPATTREDLVALMFGRDVSRTRLPRAHRRRSPALLARGVSYGRALKPVDVTVQHGEVLALTGASGAGASELAAVLAGVTAPTTGRVEIPSAGGGRTRSLRGRNRAVEAGVGYLPANRKRDGVLLERSLTENLLLVPQHGPRHAFYWPPSGRRQSLRAVEQNNVKAGDVGQRIMTLSGGNQQKVILARWLLAGSRVLVLDEPTAGIDVASKFEIYRRLLDLSGDGFAVVIVSSDYEEIACLADRVLLMSDGAIADELDGETCTAEELYRREMTGAA